MAVCEQTTRRINRNRSYSETFTFSCNGVPRDLTGYEFTFELRKTVNAPDPTLLTLTSTPAAGITILPPATDGMVQMVITEAQTAALPSGVFPFNLYFVTGLGDKETAISGHMSVHDSVAI